MTEEVDNLAAQLALNQLPPGEQADVQLGTSGTPAKLREQLDEAEQKLNAAIGKLCTPPPVTGGGPRAAAPGQMITVKKPAERRAVEAPRSRQSKQRFNCCASPRPNVAAATAKSTAAASFATGSGVVKQPSVAPAPAVVQEPASVQCDESLASLEMAEATEAEPEAEVEPEAVPVAVPKQTAPEMLAEMLTYAHSVTDADLASAPADGERGRAMVGERGGMSAALVESYADRTRAMRTEDMEPAGAPHRLTYYPPRCSLSAHHIMLQQDDPLSCL